MPAWPQNAMFHVRRPTNLWVASAENDDLPNTALRDLNRALNAAGCTHYHLLKRRVPGTRLHQDSYSGKRTICGDDRPATAAELSQLLRHCKDAGGWGEIQADHWWRANLPKPAHSTPTRSIREESENLYQPAVLSVPRKGTDL